MTRRMSDPEFRKDQERNRYAPHVRPINELVDALSDREGRGWIPYIAPLHGGTDATMLSVLRDPGPMTREGTGSGFLCTENDDPTAEYQCRTFHNLGIAPDDFTPWNAYPWYINRRPSPAELDAGVEPLARLISLLPRLHVVLLQGLDAQRSWRRLTRQHPELLRATHLTVIPTIHPSPQALRTPDPAIRQARIHHRMDAYRRAAEALHGSVGD